jgi:hypothetical protein
LVLFHQGKRTLALPSAKSTCYILVRGALFLHLFWVCKKEDNFQNKVYLFLLPTHLPEEPKLI